MNWIRNLIGQARSHWTHAGLTFVLTILAGGILLPLIRVYPESVHKYFTGLSDWLRISFILFLCIVFTAAMFRLLSPRIGHLAHWMSYPPAWLAGLLAWVVVAVIDVVGGFDPNGYRASLWEWLGYGGISIVVVGWFSGFWSDILQTFRKPANAEATSAETTTIKDIENAPWEEIETWLRSDEPARYDFLDNQSVADRVSGLIVGGTRSVGIVGPYGAGKTSLVNWVTERLAANRDAGRSYFVSHHSCWGFETSASAINDMLASAVSKLSTKIDTFQVDSLPESYRQTFSAGGDWVETISKLVLKNPDPMEQFQRLSKLLEDIGGRMVFIVEDLDRNETRNFEIQEVLAFLERLKPFPNLHFVLTGGLSSSRRIDYTKLCDHIEYLRTMQPHHSSGLIERVSERCADSSIFQYVRLGDPNRNYEWNPLSGMMMRDYEELSLPQAVAFLLNTPRSLRHALGRTFTAWHTLHGEIDFNQLLALNILRFGAPECFQFLIRRWDRLNAHPNPHPSFGRERIDAIRQAIVDDWNRTIENVEWSPAAALQVLEYILPATEYWLVDSSRHDGGSNTLQSIHQERYWRRAVNESIDANDVRDQQVIEEVQDWIANPRSDSRLVNSLFSSNAFVNIWERYAPHVFDNKWERLLLLYEHVFDRVREQHQAEFLRDNLGLIAIRRYARCYSIQQNSNAQWLNGLITQATEVSLELVNSLWGTWGVGSDSILQEEDRSDVRQHALDELRKMLVDGNALISRLHPDRSATLYQLVFDPGNDRGAILNDVRSWSWLGPIILEAVRSRNVRAVANCGVLLGTRVSCRERMTVDVEVLDAFFGDSAAEVIDILEEMADQIPEQDQMLVRNVVGAARQHFAGTPSLVDEEEGDDDAN
jgi:hypothetical protein